MSVDVMEARAPYVDFELRAIEDRGASIEAGHYMAKDVPFALITPMGSKDRVERVASEWFAHIEEESRQGRFPREWVRVYKDAFKEWMESGEIPIDGTAVKTCPIFSPAQVRLLLDLNVRTLEDLQQANEETLGRIGMGSHDLKAKAKAFLEAAKDKGKLSAEIAAVKAENRDLKDTVANQTDTIKELDARLKALEDVKKQKL